jgi:hypothetical protein
MAKIMNLVVGVPESHGALRVRRLSTSTPCCSSQRQLYFAYSLLSSSCFGLRRTWHVEFYYKGSSRTSVRTTSASGLQRLQERAQ